MFGELDGKNHRLLAFEVAINVLCMFPDYALSPES